MNYHKSYPVPDHNKLRCGGCGQYADCPILHNAIWMKAQASLVDQYPDFVGHRTRGNARGISCIRCTQVALGRKLNFYDLKVVPFNYDVFRLGCHTLHQRGVRAIPPTLHPVNPEGSIACTLPGCAGAISRFRFKGAPPRGLSDNLCFKHLVEEDSPSGALEIHQLEDHRQNAMMFWGYDEAMNPSGDYDVHL